MRLKLIINIKSNKSKIERKNKGGTFNEIGK